MNIKETTIEVLTAILPVVFVVTILQFTIIKLPWDIFGQFIGGSIMVMLGLIFFLLGVQTAFVPMGEMMGSKIVTKGRMSLVLIFGFTLGFVITIAEPHIQVLASQVSLTSGGQIGKTILIFSVALGVGISVLLGLLRIFLEIPLLYLLLPGYGIIFIITLFVSPEYLAVALDSGGVITGPMTVPFVLAVGIGVASTIRSKVSEDDSFGLVALACIGPIIAVSLLGVIF
ncbi:MAG: DUF1538 domain-containing protein [Desulfitobacteriia bacterium]